MKKNASKLMILAMVVLGTACNTPRPAGGTDSGSITIPDTGARDAAMVRDGGGSPRDTGGGGGSCTITVEPGNFGSLSAGCFPRCSGATLTTLNACTTAMCQQTTLDGDTTPGIAWSANGMAQTAQLDCAGCFANQQLHCIATSGCATEVDAYLTCLSGGGMPTCTAEVTAVNDCAMTNQTAINDCANDPAMGIVACFGS